MHGLILDIMLFLMAEEVPANVADSLKQATGVIVEKIKEDPSTFLSDLGSQAIHFGLKVLAALLIYFVGAWLIRKVKNILMKMFDKRHTESTLVSFVMSFVSIGLYVLLAIITVSTLGINTTSLAALLAAGGMAVGMALSGTVQNFAGGIMILVFKPFKVGDFISAQGFLGTVSEVTMVSTKIVTLDNRVVVLPNGALSNGTIDNYSGKPLRRVDWTVSVEYGSDADKCIAAIMEILSADSRILNSSVPGAADPFVALSSLNDHDISFTVRVWVNAADYWGVFFDGNKNFYTILQQKGFAFAYPHMDVTIKS